MTFETTVDLPIPGGPVRSHARTGADIVEGPTLARLKCFTAARSGVSPELASTKEGRTDLYVPRRSLVAKAPATHPVFFNPAAKTNRDVSVAVAAATRPRTYLDALAGIGARGVRVANESGQEVQVTLVDFNVASLAVARRNVKRNGVGERCTVVHSEANRFLVSRFEKREKFDSIDVDPFGTPAPFAQAATVAAADGCVVSMTATDAAVLCGVYPDVSRRRYGASAVRSDFVHETGLRILLGFAARMGGVNDIGVEPVAAHSTLHYLRVFFRVRRGAARADESARSLGYVTQCNECGARSSGALGLERCPACAKRVRSAGPLWTGRMVDEEVVAMAAKRSETEGWKEAAEALGSLRGLDRYPPYSYSPERVCSRLRIPSVPTRGALEALASLGFAASKSPFEQMGIKTDAAYADFVSALQAASRKAA
jgi:tRNA (guanine26-N2/guanine27-N2)-dimethyltransferase